MITLACGSAALTAIDHEIPDDAFREYTREISGDCDVISVGKFRNGSPKAWCKTHAEFVRSGQGTTCVASGTVYRLRCLSMDVDKFDGGIGIWGSLPPAIDTAPSGLDFEALLKGVHVHARRDHHTNKEVDDTYDMVVLFRDGHPLITLDTHSATALVQSRIANMPTRLVQCSHCNADHLDEGWFAVNLHRKHQCLCCGREFWQKNGDAGNALDAKLQEAFPIPPTARVDPNRTIDLGAHTAAGRHIRVWGTHQALVWTADRPEESGVHVHVYDSDGRYVVDETFDGAIWKDIVLDAEQVRLIMLQGSLEYLRGRIAAVVCESCGSTILSRDSAAVNARRHHLCDRCGHTTTTRLKLVSNPLALLHS